MADNSSLVSVTQGIIRSPKPIFSARDPSVDQALGVAASVGLSLAVVRWLYNAAFHRPRLTGDNDANTKDPDVVVVRKGVSSALLTFIRRTLRRMILDSDELRQYEAIKLEDEVHAVDASMITHQGSCHCRSVRFELKAPRTLVAKEGPGKIQYRHTEVKSSSLRLMSGQNHLKTYYVESPVGAHDRGAHAFCERCGCHVLFAPSKNSNRLIINVNCIDEGIRKIRVVETKDNLAVGAAVPGQWDDQLTTISEGPHDHYHQVKNAQFQYAESLSTGSGENYALYDDEKMEGGMHKAYFAPYTPTTVDSLTANATETQSLPPLRITGGRGASDSASVITESDSYSMAQSEFGYSGRSSSSPSKPLPQLRDQMKYFMKKHVSPKKAESR